MFQEFRDLEDRIRHLWPRHPRPLALPSIDTKNRGRHLLPESRSFSPRLQTENRVKVVFTLCLTFELYLFEERFFEEANLVPLLS